jgi:H+-translocating NAD(P) transhydrogenase subunit alpha
MCGFENSSECLLRCRKDNEDFSRGKMNSSILINALFIFMLAGFIGFEVIRRVSPLLHTPLMSLTNALDAIAVVGAIVLVGEHKSSLSVILGTIAVVAATSNIVGGFLITDRMLKMFKSSRPAAK